MPSAASGSNPYLAEPCTGRRVDLPAVPLGLHAAAFSVAGGDAFPDVVAFFDRESRHHHVLVARISEDGGGAGGWESYRLYLSTGGFGSFRYGTVVGDEVWYVDGLGKAVALDLCHDGDHWRVLCGAGWGRRNGGGGRQFFLVADTTESGEPTVVRVSTARRPATWSSGSANWMAGEGSGFRSSAHRRGAGRGRAGSWASAASW